VKVIELEEKLRRMRHKAWFPNAEVVAAPVDLDGYYEIIDVGAFDNKGKVLVALGRIFDDVGPPPAPKKKGEEQMRYLVVFKQPLFDGSYLIAVEDVEEILLPVDPKGPIRFYSEHGKMIFLAQGEDIAYVQADVKRVFQLPSPAQHQKEQSDQDRALPDDKPSS